MTSKATPARGLQERMEGVVKLLLQQRSVDPNKADETYGRTALSWAAGHGHDAVVKELLSYGSHNPNGADRAWGKAPQVIKVFFFGKKFVKYNKPDKDGRTPVWWAARNGHEGMMKLLLARGDVNPNRPDSDTPLLRAAWRGHEGVVKLLLS
ncbi:ankyrin [Choiromyces venosus 120613-1]|uniref:Ankyrin n=1 Tax=Choiromyces venosus 120613-1 TaxID=1336337 RepID=A0A3N4JHM4_9PEZI|nr:ankyrin [Choiromyces venosus 120613-1]